MIEKHGLSTNALKMAAMVSMLTDHVGYVFFPDMTVLRYIGRVAFPIYCFLLAEGFFHTHSVKKYLMRMVLFAVLSEIPFDLAFHGVWYYPQSNSVFLTLAIGLGVMAAAEAVYRKKRDRSFGILFCMIGMIAAYVLHTDYQYTGILLIYIFYLAYEGRNYGTAQSRNVTTIVMILMFALLILFGTDRIEHYALWSLPFLLLYSGKKSGEIWKKLGLEKIDKIMTYVFYLFYPVHLLIIALIHSMI